MNLTPMTKPLLSAMEAAEGPFYKYVFGKYAEHLKGECEFSVEPQAQKRGESI